MGNRNFTKAEEIQLLQLYKQAKYKGKEGVMALAKVIGGRSHRSVIAKLVQLKAYQAPIKSKKGDGHTVKSLQKGIQDVLGITFQPNPAGVIDIMYKPNLAMLLEASENRLANSENIIGER